jgi:hypothetical protein
VPERAKVNAEKIHIETLLRPLVEACSPDLCPGQLGRVWVHHDGASVHTSIKTNNFIEGVAETTGIWFIGKDEIPAKSPDAPPLDFYGFYYLKGKLRGRRPRTVEGLRRRNPRGCEQ